MSGWPIQDGQEDGPRVSRGPEDPCAPHQSYLFENWKLALAAFFPYFFLSFTLGSLVMRPCFLRRPLKPAVEFKERLRDSVSEGPGLGRNPSAVNICDDIEFIRRSR